RGFEPADIHRTAGDRDVARLLREALCRAVRPSLRTIADAVRLLAAGQLPDRAVGGAADAFPRGGQRRAAAARDLLSPAASATPGGFDVEEAARLVLDWWQARREAVGPGQYGVTVARVAAVTYSKPADDPSLLISGIGRAEALGYRDECGLAVAALGWSEIECRLRRAYRSLKAAVGAGNS